MADRIRTLTVILDEDYRDEEGGVDVIVQAVGMVKGVSRVLKGEVNDRNTYSAREDFARNAGRMISELAVGHDSDFLNEVLGAYAKLKARRGY